MARHRNRVVEKLLVAYRSSPSRDRSILNPSKAAVNIYSDTSSLFSNANRHADAKTGKKPLLSPTFSNFTSKAKYGCFGRISVAKNWRGRAAPSKEMLCCPIFSYLSRWRRTRRFS